MKGQIQDREATHAAHRVSSGMVVTTSDLLLSGFARLIETIPSVSVAEAVNATEAEGIVPGLCRK